MLIGINPISCIFLLGTSSNAVELTTSLYCSVANNVLYEVDGENKLLQISESKENLSI